MQEERREFDPMLTPEQLKGLDAGILARLTMPQIETVGRACVSERYQAGQFIFRESDLSDDMYIVAEGAVELGHDLEDPARAETIGRVNPGETFGEMSLFDELPRSMDTRAATDCHVLRVSREAWQHLVEADPSLGIRLLGYMARETSFRLRMANWDLVLMKKEH